MNIHFKTAWGYIRRSPFQALAAIFVLSITFFVASVLGMLLYSSDQTIKYFETRPQVIAFLKDDSESTQITTLEDKLKTDTRVTNVIYRTKEDALEIYKDATSDNPLLSELVSPDIFPASIEFSLTDLNYAENVISEVKSNTIVDEVGFTANLGGSSTLNDVVGRLRSITWYIRTAGLIFVSLLLGTSFLVLIIIISMRITTRRGEIEILNLIGATPSFIRNPILIEALAYGITGAFLGWIAALVLFLYATPSIVSYFGQIPLIPKNPYDLLTIFGIILAFELLAGIVLALSGSLFAVARSGKRK